MFMNSKKSKTSKNVLILSLPDKIDLQRDEKRHCFIKS